LITVEGTCVYFFCSTGYAGTAGIRGVKNFVAFFASYGATFCALVKPWCLLTEKQATPTQENLDLGSIFYGTYLKWLRL
tara:strand:+ start:237 stop:473 length:237 start_codon:yes stop_codon:yes gene_type:complete